MKKLFSLILSLCFLLAATPVAFAADNLSSSEISTNENTVVTSSVGSEFE